MDAGETRLLRESLARALDDAADPRAAVRDFGWFDVLAHDAEAAVSTLFGLCGERLLPGSFLDDVLADALGQPAVRVVLPPVGGADPASTLLSQGLIARGIVQSGDGPVLVPTFDGDGKLVVALVDLAVDPAVDGLDPEAGWTMLDEMHCPAYEIGPSAVEWTDVVAAGRRALAAELTAVGTAMLTLAVEHVRTRRQFGRPVGSFQAVQQPLAEVRLWQETAELAAAAAWEDGGAVPAALAKLLASRFTAAARAYCQQALGGMGFTWEFPFHRYLRRALALEPLLGSAPAIRVELGTAVAQGRIPDTLAAL